MMREHAYEKCGACNEVLSLHKLTTCDNCFGKFCDEHLYIGIDTGDYHLKNFCEECMEILNISQGHKGKKSYDSTSNLISGNPNFDSENKQINISLLKKSTPEVEQSINNFCENITTSQINKNKPENNKQKWEYKSVFLAIDSDVEVDEQILDHIVQDYLNVFPVNRNTIPDNNGKTKTIGIDIQQLNELGDEGWEIVTSIPKTKSIILIRKNGKPTSSVSANVSGAYMILKREK